MIDSNKRQRFSTFESIVSSSPTTTTFSFNDSTTADVILHLHLHIESPPSDPDSTIGFINQDDVNLHLHSNILRRTRFFSALLSDRWQNFSDDSNKVFNLNLEVPASVGSIKAYLEVLQLLYAENLSESISSVSYVLSILPVALELLFEDCVSACVQFLEGVPWSEEEEIRVLALVPLLGPEESHNLLARVVPVKENPSEEMLYGLILTAIHSHQNMAFPKAFVAMLLRDFSSRDSAKRVLERAFTSILKSVKEALEEYSSPDFRGVEHFETEAIQRLNLHKALTNGRHLLWLIERMIELRVADGAVKEWTDQGPFTLDLQRAFRDDAWKYIGAGVPAVVLRCTCRLANAVATGSVLAPIQVRTKLVKDWLPVLIVCRDNVLPVIPNHKSLYQELEETFLKIISTLPMSDAQELLIQCLSFSTRDVDACPHLVLAFNTWFRRATRTNTI
ncbi:hypothetical protein GIB67_005508 [Kingdonia uniflora]|uniref:At3g05675-like ankyrin-like domain-containing protein n=1 Tax=Kingdonia uniflora TaxID=39325 RepID=A0A7J7NHI2_9MAGN|nr:hypothetical protein GIB67_005508 [Kingdonia uniflora]